jgi:hypothetical protein
MLQPVEFFLCERCLDNNGYFRGPCKALKHNLITQEEFLFNTTLRLIDNYCDHCMPSILLQFPITLMAEYRCYLEKLLIPTDFMPDHVFIHVVPSQRTEETSRAKAVELRPRFQALLQHVTRRAGGLNHRHADDRILA